METLVWALVVVLWVVWVVTLVVVLWVVWVEMLVWVLGVVWLNGIAWPLVEDWLTVVVVPVVVAVTVEETSSGMEESERLVQLKRIRHKQSTRRQHLSRLKAYAFLF